MSITNEREFYRAIAKHSLVHSSNNQLKILHDYYKFTMYRNPAERLFSAYRDKVEKYPMLGLQTTEPHFNWVRMDIYRYKYPEKFKEWRENGGREAINISFSDFIDYWLEEMGHKLTDHHFVPIFSICQPCSVRYHYYGKFSSLQRDAQVLLKHVGADLTVLKESYYQASGKISTELLAPKYYNLLSETQKGRIIRRLALDLLFYYKIFPEERDAHKLTMSTDIDIEHY